MLKYIQEGPVVIMALEGVMAVSVVRKMVGSTYPNEALPGTIRGDFSMSIARNIIHSSEDLKSAQREIKLYFKPSELFEYERPNEAFHHDTDRGE